jgi:hypothetical protein
MYELSLVGIHVLNILGHRNKQEEPGQDTRIKIRKHDTTKAEGIFNESDPRESFTFCEHNLTVVHLTYKKIVE